MIAAGGRVDDWPKAVHGDGTVSPYEFLLVELAIRERVHSRRSVFVGRGNEVRRHLKGDQPGYPKEKKIKDIVKKLSEFTSYPVQLAAINEVQKVRTSTA